MTHLSIAKVFADWAYDGSGSPADDQFGTIEDIVRDAADTLLSMHAETGLDLTDRVDNLVNLVALVYPDIILEGTCTNGVDEHLVKSPDGAGETGRYWLLGRTDLPCNGDAWGAMSGPHLGWTR